MAKLTTSIYHVKFEFYMYNFVLLHLYVCFTSCSYGIYTVDIFTKQSQSFLKHQISKHFLYCDFVFAFDHSDFLNKNNFGKIESLLVSLSTLPTGGFFPVNLSSTPVDGLHYERFQDVHRYSKGRFCSSIVIATETHKYDDTYRRYFELLTSLYGPLTKKDEDYYFFVSEKEEVLVKDLLSPQFGSKIKFKIGIHSAAKPTLMNGNNGKSVSSQGLTFKSIHFYRNHGQPDVVSFDFKEQGILSVQRLFPDFTSNHYGRPMRISCPLVTFRMEIYYDTALHKMRMKRGYYKYWVEAAMKKFNFTYEIFYSSDGRGTGIQLENGTWKGGVADVLYEKADWSVTIGHIYARHKYVEWSAPLSYEWMVFVCHKPRTFVSPKAIFWPFTTTMWGLLFVSFLLVVMVFKLLIWFHKSGDFWGWGRMICYVYAIFVEQDYISPGRNVPQHSIRVFCAFWLIFGMVVSYAYRAKLVSVIAFPIKSWIPETFEDLAYSNFKSGLNVVGKGDAAYTYFSTTTSPIFRRMFQRMEINPNGLECLKKANKEDICFILWKGIAEYNDIRNISDKFGRSPLQYSFSTTNFIADGMAWAKRAIFRQKLDLTIWNARSMGLIPQWLKMDWEQVRRDRNQWETATNVKQRNYGDKKGPQKLKIIHFFGALLILFTGCIVALIVIASEKLILRNLPG